MKSLLTIARGLRNARRSRHGFTLVEILVTVALLAFIILGLYAMFSQVQRAFRQSMGQVDLLEAGRAVTEMLPRELEQVVPAGHPYPYGVNFCVQLPPGTPLTMPLPGSSLLRTNLLQDCFLLRRDNQTWEGIGYCVRTNDAEGRLWLAESGPGQMSVGSLYRFYARTNFLGPRGLPSDPSILYRDFQAACVSGSAASRNISNRICDGVIHFYFRTFAPNSFPIFSDGVRTNAFYRADGGLSYPWVYGEIVGAWTDGNFRYPDNLAGCYFLSNALPAYVEMELGILDQRAWKRFNAIGAPAAQLAYLRDPENLISGRLQLFRQRIPIRNVDPSAYQ